MGGDSIHRWRNQAGDQFIQADIDNLSQKVMNDHPESRRFRLRAVSRDDELIERGANPRTGIVSPYVASENNHAFMTNDYITSKMVSPTPPSSETRTGSGRWEQDDLGWNLVSSSPSSTLNGIFSKTSSNKAPGRNSFRPVRDSLPSERSGAHILEPDTVRYEQTPWYRQHIESVFKCEKGEDDMYNPPSTRVESPRLPSTPLIVPKRIQRKAVGSDPKPRRLTNDCGIVRGAEVKQSKLMNSIALTEECDCQVGIIKPLGTTEGQPPEGPPGTEDPLCPEKDSSKLSDSLPELRIKPSNTLGSSYRRPEQLRRARPPAPEQHQPAFENVSTRDASVHLRPVNRLKRGPRMQAQNGSSMVRKDDPSIQLDHTMHEQHAQTLAFRKEKHNPVTGKQVTMSLNEKAGTLALKYSEKTHTRDDMTGACFAARNAMLHNESRLDSRQVQTKKPFTRNAELEGASKDGASMHSCKDIGSGLTAKLYNKGDHLGLKRRYCARKEHMAPLYNCSGTCGECFVASQALNRGSKSQSNRSEALVTKNESLIQRQTSLQQPTEVKFGVSFFQGKVQRALELSFNQQRLRYMLHHILSTLRRVSAAIRILTTPDAGVKDFILAFRDLILAFLYLLVVLNILMALKKVVSTILYPMRLILSVLKWCLLD